MHPCPREAEAAVRPHKAPKSPLGRERRKQLDAKSGKGAERHSCSWQRTGSVPGIAPRALQTMAETPQQQQTHPCTTFPLKQNPPKLLLPSQKPPAAVQPPVRGCTSRLRCAARAERRDPELSNETGIYLVQALRICSLVVVGSYYQTELRYQ